MQSIAFQLPLQEAFTFGGLRQTFLQKQLFLESIPIELTVGSEME